MPRSKTNVKRQKPLGTNVVEAAKLVLQGKSTLRQAASQFNVSKSTLSRHLIKHTVSGNEEFFYEAHQDVKKVFTQQQEDELASYLVESANIHYGLSTTQVRRLAFDYAEANKLIYPESWNKQNINMAGKEWLRYFLKRHPSLSVRKPQATSLARSTSFNRNNVNTFFDKLDDLMARFNFNPDRIYNLDETGISTAHTPVRIITAKGTKQVGSMTSAERGLNITIIASINGIGNSVPPMFIFPRVFFKEHMLKGAPVGSVGTANSSGWSNANIFIEYLKHFIQHTQASIENKVLLILDNHESHISLEALNLAKSSGIHMLTFPPHTSHKLQPLDRAVFGPFKKYYNTACNEWLLTNCGKPMSIYDVAECVGKAYPQAFTPRNIYSGFSVSGIFPLNRNVFTDEEFLSSYVTDRPAQDHPINLDTPANQPSTSGFHLTPEQIRPLPKAPLRKNERKGGRKPGRCRIVTDTPEKQEIELQAQMKTIKKVVSQEKKKQIARKVLLESSSEEDYEEATDDSPDDEFDLSEVEQEIDRPTNDCLTVGNYLLVKLETKRARKYYIATITELGHDNVSVKYLMKNKLTRNFLVVDESIYQVPHDDIIMILNNPITVGGTARKCKELKFDIDLSFYEVE